MKKTILIFITILSLSLTSCGSKTPLSPENQIYSGKWVASDGTYIQLYNNGGGDLKTSNSSVSGGNATLTDTTIHIGIMGIGGTYVIDEKPSEEDGVWKMKLDGFVYTKE